MSGWFERKKDCVCNTSIWLEEEKAATAAKPY